MITPRTNKTGYAPPPPSGTPWAEREISKGIAFRERPDGEIVKFETCFACKNWWLTGEAKLGYESGHGLCPKCTETVQLSDRRSLAERIEDMLKQGPLSGSALAKMLNVKPVEIEKCLRVVPLMDKIQRNGPRWALKSEESQ